MNKVHKVTWRIVPISNGIRAWHIPCGQYRSIHDSWSVTQIREIITNHQCEELLEKTELLTNWIPEWVKTYVSPTLGMTRDRANELAKTFQRASELADKYTEHVIGDLKTNSNVTVTDVEQIRIRLQMRALQMIVESVGTL